MREADRERQKREWEMKERQAEEQRTREEELRRRQQEEMAIRIRRQEEELHRRQQENNLFMQVCWAIKYVDSFTTFSDFSCATKIELNIFLHWYVSMTIIWFSYLRSRQFAAAVAKITTLSVTMIVTDMVNLMVSKTIVCLCLKCL